MKKLLLLFVFMLPLVFSGCSSDDDSLEGTVWETTDSGEDWDYKATITFSKSTFSVTGYYKYDENGDGVFTSDEIEPFNEVGTYTYDEPNIIVVWDGEEETGTISGNKMTIGEETYYKK